MREFAEAEFLRRKMLILLAVEVLCIWYPFGFVYPVLYTASSSVQHQSRR